MNIETIRADMIKAMKEKDKTLKDVTSSLIAAIKKVAIDEGVRDDIPEELVDRVILKELKSTKEQIDTCPDERAELKAEYQAKYDIITTYAPKQLTEEEIVKIVTEKFADVMNAKAAELGMTNSHFVTPSGLDNVNHYSTAYDMALLTVAALKNDTLRNIFSQTKITVTYGNPPYQRTLYNHNKLLDEYEYCIEYKTDAE